MRKGLLKMLRQTAESAQIKDGMDLAVCSIDLQRMKLEFAGAHNPAWILRGSECIELKADKIPIGAFVGDAVKPFTPHEFNLLKGDRIYLFTDGYADQFGGERGKKFKYRRLRELLQSTSGLPMEEQHKKLEAHFVEWKGGLEQVDDVCIMGIGV
jgi:serine phosphatase RsbU (regulator of sigma subunit)